MGVVSARGVFPDLETDVIVEALESIPDACTLSRVVRDERGRAMDMTLLWMNRTARLGQPDPERAIGRRCTELWPQMVANGSFAACLRVLETGEAERGEFHWQDKQTDAPSHYEWSATRVAGELLLWTLRDASERLRRTLESEARLAGILATAPDAIIVMSERGIIRSANAATENLLGWTPAELVGRPIEQLMSDDDAKSHGGHLERYARTGERHIIGVGRDVTARHRDGRLIPARLSVGETVVGGERTFTGILHDLSQRQMLEAQLRHAQKMEVVGRLVATVAHDFNNVLTISTAATALLDQMLTDKAARELVSEISDAAQRGAAMTAHLLAFSRTKHAPPKTVDPVQLVSRLHKLATRLVGPSVRVVLDFDSDVVNVRVDEVALEQAILNLIVNARDAMPNGGSLRLGVALADVPGGERAVRISVTDDGTGMTPEVKARAFEPFYTTKPEGRGTGLGLSSVLDTVAAMDGEVRLDSEPGRGTTVSILIPPATDPTLADSDPVPSEARGTETLLLADDDPAIRRLVGGALERKGYRVHRASSYRDAMARFDELGGNVDVLIADMVLPDGDGRTLAQVLDRRRPRLAVILISGFVPGTSDHPERLPEGALLLAKPFSARQLALEVRKLLDGARAQPPSSLAAATSP